MTTQLSDYQRGYLAGLQDKPKRKAAIFAREIKPECLDYPSSMRDKKAAYLWHSSTTWTELKQFFEDDKKAGCELVTVAFPEVLGDNYLDMIGVLSLLAENELHLGIVGKSPFLVEWRENYPIFKVPKT